MSWKSRGGDTAASVLLFLAVALLCRRETRRRCRRASTDPGDASVDRPAPEPVLFRTRARASSRHARRAAARLALNRAHEPPWRMAICGSMSIRQSWSMSPSPSGSVPFWLADQNFVATTIILSKTAIQPGAFIAKRSSRGWIGLGVNGLDRSPCRPLCRLLSAAGTGGRIAIRLSRGSMKASHQCGEQCSPRPASARRLTRSNRSSRLPPELDGTVMIQPAHAARHSTLVAAGRVWKTHVVSTAIPDQVTIAFGDDPARELVWTWRTSVESPSTAIRVARLQDRVARRAAGSAATAQGAPGRIVRRRIKTVDVPNLLNDPIIRRHRARVDGLEPDTVYQYALGDGTPGGWGPWRAVKTAPGPWRSTKFLYLGDAQTGLERWGRLLDGRSSPTSRCRLSRAGRRPGRSRQRADQLGPFLPEGRRRLRSRAADALRG